MSVPDPDAPLFPHGVPVTLVQAFRFPNVWTVRDSADKILRIFKDHLDRDGSYALHAATRWSQDRNLAITATHHRRIS